eukprot:scaffold6979_cov60-Phaeocystis_antarctica.AAC.5
MPAGGVRAGKEPDATLCRLCAAARAVELIAQPGEVRWSWRLCPRDPSGLCSAQMPRGPPYASTQGQLEPHRRPSLPLVSDVRTTCATVLRAEWWRVEGCAVAEERHVQMPARVPNTQAHRRRIERRVGRRHEPGGPGPRGRRQPQPTARVLGLREELGVVLFVQLLECRLRPRLCRVECRLGAEEATGVASPHHRKAVLAQPGEYLLPITRGRVRHGDARQEQPDHDEKCMWSSVHRCRGRGVGMLVVEPRPRHTGDDRRGPGVETRRIEPGLLPPSCMLCPHRHRGMLGDRRHR